ncbi:hypothetical protein JTE90_022299 [Oedothorax gibbosus]|uniref:Uncharacterized protein n=1 Tax=Oedothorax gibbosus TaxID=931172 RepID=A0AAV6VYP3_9ARAC|nr:hypothetical protein JTE90_022299 [Oedothorax gibbosus]
MEKDVEKIMFRREIRERKIKTRYLSYYFLFSLHVIGSIDFLKADCSDFLFPAILLLDPPPSPISPSKGGVPVVILVDTRGPDEATSCCRKKTRAGLEWPIRLIALKD